MAVRLRLLSVCAAVGLGGGVAATNAAAHALVATSPAPAVTPATAPREAGALVLAMKLVHGQVSSDSRYLYVGAPSARTATIWDSRTGHTRRIALPAGCGGIDPVLGSGVAFFVCGAETVSAWAYAIPAHRWTRVPTRVIDRYCSSGPNGGLYAEDVICTADGAGTRWVSWSGQPGCYSCDPSDTYYNLRTQKIVVPTAAQSNGYDINCLLILGCDNLDAASLNLNPRAGACRPLPAGDDYQPLADGWIALEPPSQDGLSLGRCGSSRLRRLAINPITVEVSGPLALWEPDAGDYTQARVYNATLNRIFTMNITGAASLVLGGMVGDRVYAQGNSLSPSIYYVGTLPGMVDRRTGGRSR